MARSLSEQQQSLIATLADQPEIAVVAMIEHAAGEGADGGQAARLLQGPEVALCPLDLKMPSRDGMDLLRGHSGRLEETPIIVLTAYGGSKAAIEAMKLGAFEHLTKPLRRRDIEMLIERMLSPAAVRPPVHRQEP